MHFSVISLFPEFVETVTQYGVVGRAFANQKASLHCVNPRDFTTDRYQTVDDRPYGGGPGMLMLAEPLYQSIQAAKQQHRPETPVIYLSPAGEPLTQSLLFELSQLPDLILLSGRYEGIDQRLIETSVDREISVGDYVLSGGELPAMVLMDGIIRLLPEVLGHEASAQQDSFVDNQLDCPHYTRPEVWQNQTVPDVLLSGNHAAIEQWRAQQAEKNTKTKRPDLSEKNTQSLKKG